MKTKPEPDAKAPDTTEIPDATETEDSPKSFSQADVDAVAAKVRKEAREAAMKEAREAAEKALADAEKARRDEALKDQQKFEELAEARAKEIADLTTRGTSLAAELDETKALLERANTALETHLATLEKGLTIPNGVKELLQGKSVVERLEWLSKNAETFKSVAPDEGDNNQRQTKQAKQIPPTPAPRDKPEVTDKARKAVHPRSYL